MSHHETNAPAGRLRRFCTAVAERWTLRLTAVDLPDAVEASHWALDTPVDEPDVHLPRRPRLPQRERIALRTEPEAARS